jgi:hypothetical protein
VFAPALAAIGDERPGKDRTNDRGVQDDRAGEVAAEIVRGRDLVATRIGSSGYGSLLMILVIMVLLVIFT